MHYRKTTKFHRLKFKSWNKGWLNMEQINICKCRWNISVSTNMSCQKTLLIFTLKVLLKFLCSTENVKTYFNRCTVNQFITIRMTGETYIQLEHMGRKPSNGRDFLCGPSKTSILSRREKFDKTQAHNDCSQND